ncbi:uncharacterized protein LOC142976869 [Anticarsia gemmatalis]|uniref:uncharacterized protein LOC142976869 n=1 Tax=Anticarsia gemmatalis TaxID=129554 RepID=UPI003F76D117
METKLCRLCCKNEATSYIFHKEPDGTELSAKIMYCCANIDIKDGDGLPAFVCDSCEQELDTCYRFVLKCEASDKQLRSQSLSIISQVIANLDGSTSPVEVKAEIKYQSDDDNHYEDPHSDDIPLDQLRHDTASIKYENVIASNTKRKPHKTRIKYKNSGPKKCTVCGRQCTNQSTLVIHMRSHTNEYSYPCSLCDKKYKDGGNLKRHMDRHHSEHTRMRNFICESCGKGFFSKSDVTIHMRTHTGETPYSCTECAARFTQLGALIRHKKRHTGEKDHMCSICPKRFCTKEELKMHHVVHSTEKKYSCPLCDTSFKHQSNLTKHIRLHTESRNFICNYCGRNFKFKGNLKLHIERQHSEKSGFCDLCSRHAPNLETHMWRHTGERPLKCEMCTSSFFELKALARHVNFKHTKTDRYKCDVEGCSMMFPSRPMLDFHIAKLHGTHIPFPCDRCTRAFYRKNDLARHKIGTHKERLV